MIAALIQARMGSTRLPGKVLTPVIDAQPILKLMLARVRLSERLGDVVVVTSDLPGDDAIEQWCKANSVAVFRGSESDVLDRYAQALKARPEIEHAVRLTADCVLHHGAVIDQVIEWYVQSKGDYFSNSNHEPDILEDGFDVEVFTRKALMTAAEKAKLRSEREHVTPFIKNSGLFQCGWRKVNPSYHFKLSVDSPADMQLAKKIFEHFRPRIDFTMDEVVKLLKDRPELLEINSESEVNSGYKKSLEEDQKTTEK